MLFAKIVPSKGNGLSFKSDKFFEVECWELKKITDFGNLYHLAQIAFVRLWHFL